MRRFVLVLLAITLLGGCIPKPPGSGPPAPSTGSQPAPAPSASPVTSELMTSPDYGIQVFLWGNAPTTARDLKLAKDAGFRWVKQMFQWDFIEGKGKGKFEWGEPDRIVEAVRKQDLKLLARLDVAPMWARGARAKAGTHGPPTNMQDYGDFAGAVAERYRGRIQVYQIWNEANLAREWNDTPPSPAEFTQMMKVAYTAIKKADPNAIVVPGGLSPTTAGLPLAMPDVQFLREMYKAGAGQYFDMLGMHAAGFLAPPDMDPGDVAKDPQMSNPGDKSPVEAKRVYSFRHAEDLRKVMVENGDEKKRVIVLEFGWTTDQRLNSPYRWHALDSEHLKGSYIVRAYQFAQQNWRPWIGLMSLIYVCAPTWSSKDEQYYWCITDEDGDNRPSYDAVKAMKKN